MDIIFTLSILGSVASIVGLLLPAADWKVRWMHAIYGMAIVLLCYAVISSNHDAKKHEQELSRIKSVQRAAKILANSRDKYTQLGYIQASLAFLETNQEFFPDSYERAKLMCEKNDCHGTSQELEHAYSMIDLSFAFSGLLRGISVITSNDS